MAGIVNGVWSETQSIDPDSADPFLNWITMDGAPGPTGRGGFRAEQGRYHIYLAQGCPSCHRVSIARQLLQLEDMFSVTYVDDIKRNDGWRLSKGADPVYGADSIHNVMIAAEAGLTAKSTVPLMIDKQSRRLVSNSSADMVRMMDQIHTSALSQNSLLWPPHLAEEIDQLAKWISHSINSGVYRVVFSECSEDKAQHNREVRAALTEVDERLETTHFLHGDMITASDVWLFPSLLRFDSIYSEIFGLNFKLDVFRNLALYLRDLWSIDAFASSANMNRIEDHYFLSLLHGPNGITEPGLGKSAQTEKRSDLSGTNVRAAMDFRSR